MLKKKNRPILFEWRVLKKREANAAFHEPLITTNTLIQSTFARSLTSNPTQ